jgi:CRISPR system Cascade subunit CasE
MFLSKLILNLRSPNVRRDLARPYEMHRTIWKAHPSLQRNPTTGAFDERILFRVDSGLTDRDPPTLLVQSEVEPDWNQLDERYCLREPACKPFDFTFTTGQRLRFRLRANVSKRVAAKNERLGGTMVGKRVGLTTETEQIRWLLRKGEVGGFQIPGEWVQAKDPETDQAIELANFRVDAFAENRIRNVKGEGGALAAVRFEGILIVTDPTQFRETLFAGVGPAKGMGFGLLSVAQG